MSKSMRGLVAPVLTYTADEILEYAPQIFKGDMENIFDLVYEPLPAMQAPFDFSEITEIREKFYEEVDKLKKEKIIKATLELELVGEINGFSSDKDMEDWFVVSSVKAKSEGEKLASFEVEGKTYSIHKATAAKCPRCWKFTSHSEECTCERCAEVVA